MSKTEIENKMNLPKKKNNPNFESVNTAFTNKGDLICMNDLERK